MQNKKINSITIVGGGTSGWMTAAALSHHFKSQPVNITLIESSSIGTVGVGEATIPTLRRFYQKLGLTDVDVIKKTGATCKLGIEFKDWVTDGESFIHPFGLFGQGTNDAAFHHYWLKLYQQGKVADIEHFSMGLQLARHNKFCMPAPKPQSSLQIFDWALHFDAALFANLMKEFSQKNDVTLIDGIIEHTNIDKNTGDIASVTLNNGETFSSDLFIDCSGFQALLIEKALNTGYENWQQWLRCDSAVAVQSERTGEPLVRTIAQAQSAGWQWRIPLQHRQGNGYVYCSDFISHDQAEHNLTSTVTEKFINTPKKFSFVAGRRSKAWNKNCIAVGLASGFLEPLESTSIALVETAIDKIIQTFSSPEYSQSDVDKFNDVTATEYERVRDFIILHYKINGRTDSQFWQYCREMDIPDTLKEKMSLFKERGELVRYPWEIFGPDSWLAVYSGMKYLPEQYDSKVERISQDVILANLEKMQSQIKHTVDRVPIHSEFLTRFCNYNVAN